MWIIEGGKGLINLAKFGQENLAKLLKFLIPEISRANMKHVNVDSFSGYRCITPLPPPTCTGGGSLSLYLYCKAVIKIPEINGLNPLSTTTRTCHSGKNIHMFTKLPEFAEVKKTT
jgi:hypothetical protein